MTLKSEDLPALYFYIGQRIQKARVVSGFTQLELAQKTGVSRTTITNIENANQKIGIDDLYRIAEALDKTLDYLLPVVSKRILMTSKEAYLEFLNSPKYEES